MRKKRNNKKYPYQLLPPETIWAAVSGDEQALNAVYKYYKGYAVTLAGAITRKQNRKGYLLQMEDILQEAWGWILTEDIRKFRGK